MGVNLGDGTPKALRCWLERLEKNPPKTDLDDYIEIVGYIPADIEDLVEDE